MSRTRFIVNPHSRSSHKIWSSKDCKWTPTLNHLVRKRTLNHLAKLVKSLSCVLSTYLNGAFDCMFLSCRRCNSEWIHSLKLPECRGAPCSKQTRNRKFRWLQLDSDREPLSSERNTEPFGETVQMIELCAKYLSLRCIWLFVLVMSRTCFGVNAQPVDAWMSRKFLLDAGAKSEL